jgi:Response regulator containing CheY-like receiver domain and AraC-type DNA-binding domain
MKRVLIVDDESQVLDGLRSAVDWARLGAETPLVAQDAAGAQAILEESAVDIMLCDIEMPGKNGIELLAWAKEHSPDTESLILTCHADFKYAQQAVQLGIFDYVLKPIRYAELEAILGRLVGKIDERQSQASFSRFGQFWLRNQGLLAERFWLDILSQTIAPQASDIARAAAERDLPFDASGLFLPILVRIGRWPESSTLRERRNLEYEARRFAERIFADRREGALLVRLDGSNFLVLMPADERPDRASLWSGCEAFAAELREELGCLAASYIGDPVPAEGMAGLYERLKSLADDDVSLSAPVSDLHRLPGLPSRIATPDLDELAPLLAAGSSEAVIERASSYLSRWGEKLDAQTLATFVQDFMQMLLSVLRAKGVPAHLIATARTDEGERPTTVPDAKAWLAVVVEEAADAIRERQRDGQSAAERAREYIAAHIDEDLSRDAIAAEVGASPDHLSRLMKRETGLSVSEYLVRERLEMAKRLVAETDLPIGDIASRSGYSSFSHFSRIFRESTGLSPIDYRKSGRKD